MVEPGFNSGWQQVHPNGEIRGNSFVGIDRLFPDYTNIQFD
ncbi:MAG: hypothetical protein WA421_20300 [Nitrososphaeraceae archaeon]